MGHINTMKPVQVACIALICITMAIAAPAPTIILGTGAAVTTLALPTLVLGTGSIALPQPLLEPKNCSWQEPFLQPRVKALRMEEFSVYISNDHPTGLITEIFLNFKLKV